MFDHFMNWGVEQHGKRIKFRCRKGLEYVCLGSARRFLKMAIIIHRGIFDTTVESSYLLLEIK